jgi:hypothetical protein
MAVTYESLATTTLANSTTQEVIFNSFASTYTDLRIVFKGGASAGSTEFQGQFNSDSAGNYSRTRLTGDGSAVASSRDSGVTFMRFTGVGFLPNQDLAGVTIIDIMNYSNATTFKTVLSRHNVVTQETHLMCNQWRKSPEAITSIRLFTATNFFFLGSTFTPYGIKAA